ncbi:MAG: 1-acyl-sn-glycerol-3-phosphate acyltransferase [Symploca sp. SIO3C6]|uniref:1-acyl-sn-glycerol-3-phosphate acyltransferase n=1 Tax=Symploca sp. SIO1C4 TaxID=2607765 RepID=A0A6B3N3Q6_9CYAN|nr:1-acyl-sn-glycerol-3-phosphate acyltransferase [Symploca sp. SIO3C6]NER26133.1 1-acyl-sn-glycerol-3-phosphate acyltransferase [Symploca sp. SIO1C4]NET05236.1 1-acyl-sn-glycerol-3-phosphate acyltransferase [Symploca sp. SIO2B6]NET49542.1 1-acyl-sn-glycerol-3-phosphate acyltransferase [Merismopedia sp. SIO2A8]
MTRNREPFISLQLYRALKWSLIVPIFRFYLRGRVYGIENVPQAGPLVVVSNHASDFDPPIVAICMQRPVAFMAKEELFEVPLLKQIIYLYGAYPVKRGAADRSAIRSALSYLDQGWAVGIFLSGTRTPDARIPDPKLGAALIAAKAQAPLVPVSVWGTQAVINKGLVMPKSVPVTLRIGQLIDPPTSTKREELQAVTEHCAAAIHALHDLGR